MFHIFFFCVSFCLFFRDHYWLVFFFERLCWKSNSKDFSRSCFCRKNRVFSFFFVVVFFVITSDEITKFTRNTEKEIQNEQNSFLKKNSNDVELLHFDVSLSLLHEVLIYNIVLSLTLFNTDRAFNIYYLECACHSVWQNLWQMLSILRQMRLSWYTLWVFMMISIEFIVYSVYFVVNLLKINITIVFK